ncbi:MAG TPA: cyclic pyranopterin monophosphate synthase MoaC [Brevefilum fermentans]|jgi:cyclic pyranopterin phosphate synthase|uniref:Cyclic pyranopterin monophosphate synthase n=1 Tax=Candidatus Brevifilum fermentans TaxID=1986204 RepID=A0A1Y6K6A2_9CHLR|nr:cyclic pyranopterin monophosphate synthase MoaC [Brevefilum fermentans]MDI9565545.1 cyclic pyranopterin monophosphate synthase MoaC [Chloroflexota bacterium]OQB85368.1 MAG: Cyclic pyranopterin monophosphate synthase accessory protein 1 [Chloroflexi bacterium ADurb.Bin120]SMX53560.1 molybdopterin biosynthesis, protein C [Brevefilum fermentans]HOM67076.1 cyclic pyranopterin monophosphate synthase MoaC [Brevefilum fermentans]HQA29071.1 cyclic pyranopterin monophosphate synthase MoaC [Brevefilu
MALTHLNEHGEASMVDISHKPATLRTAEACATIKMKASTLEMIMDGSAPKGDVLACARIAGIMAAKRTAELIPLCHPIALTRVSVEFEPEGPDTINITARTACHHSTGVEMEALTAASLAALTIYDMCKAVDRGMEIVNIGLLKKSGGLSGDYEKGTPQA